MLWKLIHRFFEFSEKHLAPDTKDSIASWLLEAKAPEKVNTWIDTFPDVFDAVFGKRHLSWRCFWRSAIATNIGLGVVLVVDLALHGDLIVKGGVNLDHFGGAKVDQLVKG